MITKVERGGVAYQSGLRAGDIILEVNQEAIQSVKQLGREMSQFNSGDRVLLLIESRRAASYVVLHIP